MAKDDARLTPESESKGFLDRLFGLFLGIGDPERENARLVKAIAKTFAKDKYKFYRPRTGELTGAFGNFYYGIYKVTASVQALVQRSDTEGALKLVVIQSQLNDDQIAVLGRLEEQNIRERARNTETQVLVEEIRQDIISFATSFDADTIARINRTYNDLQAFVVFCSYDFYFTLRAFDSAISERAFSYKPKFEPIIADPMVDNIKDFVEAAGALSRDTDYDAVFDVLAAFRGGNPVNRDGWRKVSRVVFEVLASQVLVRIVRHSTGNPHWKPKFTRYNANIAQPYLDTIKSESQNVIRQIAVERKNSQVGKLVEQIFGRAEVDRARYYTDKVNQLINRKNAGSFRYADGFNYLKAYLLDVFKADIRVLAQDVLIVRGKWATNVHSQQLSDGYHAVLGVCEAIEAFDDSLSDEGEAGQRLRKAMARVVVRDPSTARQLRELVDELNGEVFRMITEAAQNLVIVGKVFRQLIEDVDRKNPEIVINWKELDALAEGSIKNRMSVLYRQMYYMVQLLQTSAKQGR